MSVGFSNGGVQRIEWKYWVLIYARERLLGFGRVAGVLAAADALLSLGIDGKGCDLGDAQLQLDDDDDVNDDDNDDDDDDDDNDDDDDGGRCADARRWKLSVETILHNAIFCHV